MTGEPSWVEDWLRKTPEARLDEERLAFLRALEDSQLLERFGEGFELVGPADRPEYVVYFRVPDRPGRLPGYRARVPHEDDPGIWTLLIEAIDGAIRVPPCEEDEEVVWLDWRGKRVGERR